MNKGLVAFIEIGSRRRLAYFLDTHGFIGGVWLAKCLLGVSLQDE